MIALLQDDETRRHIRALAGKVSHPTSVWMESSQTWDHTKLLSYELPVWRDLSERMKMFLGFDLAMELGWCFSFTANLSFRYVEKWEANGSGFTENIGQRVRRELRKVGIENLPHCYVVETRTKTGKSKCKPHIHGIAICDDPLKATKLKLALERAFVGDLKRNGRQRGVKVDRGYVRHALGLEGRIRWVDYITKNVGHYDERLGRRRVFMSHSYVALARKAWAIRSDELVLDEASLPRHFQ